MPRISLHPPLAQIERRLFAAPDELLQRLAEADPTVPHALKEAALADPETRQRLRTLQDTLAEPLDSPDMPESLPAPPAFIQTVVGQTIAARQADFGRPPQRGQLLRLDTVPTPPGKETDAQLAAPAVVLLAGHDLDSPIWHGWWVSPDVRYAGFWDFLLQEEDGPFAPTCGMVQIWNPARLYLDAGINAYPVGRLSEARMQAVEALVLEYLLGDPKMPRSRPGLCALRAVGDGFAAVTGTPLGQENDPRHAYQRIYHHWGALLNEPARAWQWAFELEPGLLDAVRDVVAAAWRKCFGSSPQPLAQVAYAMGGETGENVYMLALQEDLHLTLTQVGGQLDVRLSYHGETPLTATLYDGGEFAQRTVLQAGARPLEYSGLRFYGDNRMRIEWPDGRVVELPLAPV